MKISRPVQIVRKQLTSDLRRASRMTSFQDFPILALGFSSLVVPIGHFLHVKLVRYILSCCHGNKITKGTLQNLAPQKSEKSAICKDIELKFAIETKFGPLSSKTNKNLQFDIMTFLAFRPFR